VSGDSSSVYSLLVTYNMVKAGWRNGRDVGRSERGRRAERGKKEAEQTGPREKIGSPAREGKGWAGMSWQTARSVR